MSSIDEDLHRTLVQFLIDNNSPELGASMIDGGMTVLRDDQGWAYGVTVDTPTFAYDMIAGDPSLKQFLVKAVKTVITGHLDTENEPTIKLRIKLIQPEENWQQIARDLIVNYKGNNQGAITQKVFLRQRKAMLTYNEASYASQSEIRIAQELVERQILFFPLAMGVRAETGQFYLDHREADFLICDDGTWGILEVSYHPDRFEKDAEKDAWFKKSGILCVQHYTAERCFREPSNVVNEFLSILRKHQR